MMPPSPRLSARMISTTYLSETMIISAQKMVDRPPRMLVWLSGMPWSGENVSLTAYSGLVPMSPKTMPSAASVSAASEDLRWRRSRSKGRRAILAHPQQGGSRALGQAEKRALEAKLQRLSGRRERRRDVLARDADIAARRGREDGEANPKRGTTVALA